MKWLRPVAWIKMEQLGLPKLGISACLLGESVRYDGGHKIQTAILEYFKKRVLWIPVCPEMECGLSTPRDSMHLQGCIDNPSLVVSKSGLDLTEKFNKWQDNRLTELSFENLSGMVLKSKSPSCGIGSVPVFLDKKQKVISSKDSYGLFARAFLHRFPQIPLIDEVSLSQHGAMEKFLRQILNYHKQIDSVPDW